jgi:hypothetical protein
MKMDGDSSEGLMDGLRMISSDTPAGISYLVEPILDSRSTSSLFPLGTWWNSQPLKNLLSYCT